MTFLRTLCFLGGQRKGRLACPYCMDQTKAFQLKNGRKTSWFDISVLYQQITTIDGTQKNLKEEEL